MKTVKFTAAPAVAPVFSAKKQAATNRIVCTPFYQWLFGTMLLFVAGSAFGESASVGGLFPKMPPAPKVYAVDCRKSGADARLSACALQGLVNQKSAEVYLIDNN